MRSEKKNVACHRLDGEVLVHAADEGLIRIDDDAVVGELWDRAAGRHRRELRAAAGPQDVVHAVAVDIRPAHAAPGADPFGDERDDGFEVVVAQIGVRRGTADETREIVLADAFVSRYGDLGDDLLSEDVQRRYGRVHGVERACTCRAEERDTLDELVASHRVDPALRDALTSVIGATHPLEKGRDRTRRTELADEVDRSDVDAEFERRRRDDRAQGALTQPGLHGQTPFH